MLVWGTEPIKRCGAALAVAFMVTLIAAPPADAKTFKNGFMSYVREAEPAASGAAATATAACPGKRRLSGVGAALGGPARTAFPYTHVASIWPDDQPSDPDTEPDDAAIGEAHNASGGQIAVRSFAACLGPGAGGGDLSYLSQPSPFNPFNPSSNTGTGQQLTCGDTVVGGGEQITGAKSEEWLRGSGLDVMSNGKPNRQNWNTSFTINAQSGSHAAFAHAICMDGDALRIAHRYRSKVIFQDQVRVLRSPCPHGGKRGWKVLGGGWSGSTAAVLVSKPFDNRDKGNAPDDGWQVRVLHHPNGNPQALLAFAICGKRA